MGTVTVAINLADKGFSAGILQARKNAQLLKQSVKEIEGQTANSMQASSAAIRLLEGGMQNNVRAAERFISLLPGVGKALQAAFPVVGGLALLGVFVRIGEEVYKAIHTMEQLRNVTREGLLSIAEGSNRSVDAMRVTNDKLEQQIALMEHKPENSVALALDEARLKADDLENSLNRDYTAFKKLLEESKTTVLGRFFGQATGRDVQHGIDNRLANIRTLGIQQQDDLEGGNTSGAADTLAKLKQAQAEARDWAQKQIAMRQGNVGWLGSALPYGAVHGDQGQNVDVLQGFGIAVRNQQNTQTEQERNSAAVEQQKKLEAASKAREGMKQAQELLLKQDEEAEKKQNAFNKMSINETIKFWTDKLSAFQKGSQQYMQVQDRIYEEIAKRPNLFSVNKANQAAAGKSDTEGQDHINAMSEAFKKIDLEAIEKANRLLEQFNASTNRAEGEQLHAAAAYREASIALGLEDGTMSRLAAAQALASSHAKEHAAAIALVNRELERQTDLINQTPDQQMSPENKQRAIDLANQNAGDARGSLDDAYAITSKRDQANVSGNTMGGAQRDALNKMVQSWDDLAANLKQIIPQTLDSLNDNIVKAMTGQKTDFGKTFTNAGQGIMKAVLEKVEGAGLKALGFGKADGSKEAPFYTIAADGTPGGGAAGGLAGILGGRGGGDEQGGGGLMGLLSKFGGSLSSLFGGGAGAAASGAAGALSTTLETFAGALADGGEVTPNFMHLVGERGPELFVPRTAGHVIPNHHLGRMGAGDVHNHWNIDAKGATDPAAIHAAVMRAAPHIVAASVQTHHSSAMRKPQGR